MLTSASTASDRARRRIALRILPFVFVLYIVNYLDRTNIANAKLTMLPELGFSEGVYGWGTGIFFLGYLAFEIPGALIVEKFGARIWIARILVTWGLCTAFVGMISTPRWFYVARFVLGLAEAGFYPGIIVYLTHWFTLRDRARAMSSLILGVPIALGLGGPIASAILPVHWLGYSGWRWLLILEGLPAVALGIFTLFYLTDRPKHANWLAPDEREWITNALEEERKTKHETAHVTVFQAFRQRNVILLAVALFSLNFTGYGFVFYLPTVIKTASGLSDSQATFYSAFPYVCGVVAMFTAGYLSDRTGRRKLFTIGPMVLAAISFTLASVPGQPFWLVMVWLCLTGFCFYAQSPSFWVLPTMTLQAAAAAASIGMINSIGNLSGFFSPMIVGKLLDRGFTYKELIPSLAFFMLLSAVLVAALKIPATPKEELFEVEPELF